jgi:formylglycine-generating enzyme required for sulfatase activity
LSWFFPINKSRIIRHIFIAGLIFTCFGCQEGLGLTTLTPSLIHEQKETQTIDNEAGETTQALTETRSENESSSSNINSIDGAELAFIPAGVFEMGADAARSFEICILYREGCDLGDFADEEPVHSVELDAFWIYRQEVTNANYRQCVLSGDCSLPAFTDFYNDPDYADHPVVYVNWDAAVAYCEWAGGWLPTEAEWEKSARGTDGRMFPWGEEGVDCALANLSGCLIEMTAPAGSLPSGASPYDVMDMAGNVSEWVADWYSLGYYLDSPSKNPTGPETGEMKVIRGGSWKNPGVGLRSTNRGANFPEVFSTGVGFRCVLESD